MNTANELDFLVRREDLQQVRWSPALASPEMALTEGDALLRIDRYALTTNNITYARLGDTMRYWAFFPAPDGWGRIPVWGYAEVVASRGSELAEGERVFGYLPMAGHLVVRPERVKPGGFVDGSAHRKSLPSVYQGYQRVGARDAANEDLRALFGPLFGTGFLIDDWLHDQGVFGARQVLLASASSKTALSTAFCLSRRSERGFEVIGLTSSRHRAFCESVGYYDRVLDYGEVNSLPSDVPSVLIDMAGADAILRAVHTHFGAALRHSCRVGFTHPSASSAGGPALPGPAPQLFFAPMHSEKQRKEWGVEGFSARVGGAQQAFLESVAGWLQVVHGQGQRAIEETYRGVLSGDLDPKRGLILSP